MISQNTRGSKKVKFLKEELLPWRLNPLRGSLPYQAGNQAVASTSLKFLANKNQRHPLPGIDLGFLGYFLSNPQPLPKYCLRYTPPPRPCFVYRFKGLPLFSCLQMLNVSI